jgi:hypothetical protein
MKIKRKNPPRSHKSDDRHDSKRHLIEIDIESLAIENAKNFERSFRHLAPHNDKGKKRFGGTS